MPLTRARAAAEAPTLLDALARAPAAAALVVGALDELEYRRALRLAHPQLRDAVGEATTKLCVYLPGAAATRPPTPRRWPRLEAVSIGGPDLATIEALGAETWERLRTLNLVHLDAPEALDEHSARALAAALRRMPALRKLCLRRLTLSDASGGELFCPEAAPQLRSLALRGMFLTPKMARLLASTGWRLEELDVSGNARLGAAGVAALVAAPAFAIRSLNLPFCGLDAAALTALADAPWPLEELDLSHNDFSAAAAGPALAALSQHVGLRALVVSYCKLSAAGFKALVEAAWPALTCLVAFDAQAQLDGPHALGAAAFAGFPVLEALMLSGVRLGEAGVRVLASRRWARLRRLDLCNTELDAAGVAALARGAWPALVRLDLRRNGLGVPPTLEDARRWAPPLVELRL